ncbi:phosphatidylinositol transfer protein SFH5 [Capronia epimyces CBS 606.96]|uniref:Phosphatidylinositol transfer protein SFH5 n=1 Tax=Capronia epimyces CBS 606.96 TaxID=1182542 RepID=W9Y1Z8_9EURO|nr:phosphatidylinositol transfer protein SFH5 [Capronia epimyces CBS 606.96]EXJ86508.1 phosphatidylinositol transfer protein SFH5 [Capronia epimyces CBS 606.96]
MATGTTTAAPNNATLPGEVSSVIPDSAENKPAEETSPSTDTTGPVPVETPQGNKQNESTEVPVEKATTPIEQLWTFAQAHGHPEIWGVTLADPAGHVPTQIVLQKYLNANDADLAKAKEQLGKTLDWRAKIKPLDLLGKKFNRNKFQGLGYVTVYGALDAPDPEAKEVITWNIYGSVKHVEETFGNVDEFIEWRVALMEEALHSLDISKATKPITAEHDPYKIIQVHDYKSISFLRQSPVVKAASTKTIEIFAQNYPELLKEKFFVNVPAFMGFVYALMKLFVAPKTLKKFHPMSNGANLSKEFTTGTVTGLADLIPKEYGGKGSDLNSVGKQPFLEDEQKA